MQTISFPFEGDKTSRELADYAFCQPEVRKTYKRYKSTDFALKVLGKEEYLIDPDLPFLRYKVGMEHYYILKSFYIIFYSSSISTTVYPITSNRCWFLFHLKTLLKCSEINSFDRSMPDRPRRSMSVCCELCIPKHDHLFVCLVLTEYGILYL